MKKVAVSHDSGLTKWVRDNLGPDGFMVVVDGSERLVRFQPDRYLGNCEYLFALRFNNAGPINLQVRRRRVSLSFTNPRRGDL